MNVYRQELSMSIKSCLYWTFGMLLTQFFFMLMFPAVSKDAAILNQIVSKFPPALTRALGLTTLDLSTVLGFYSYMFLVILMVGSVYALKSGTSVLSEEIRAKTADFLVSKPISRSSIASGKLLSVLSLLVLQIMVYFIGTVIIIKMATGQHYDPDILILINLSLFLVQIYFAALGFLLGVVINRIRSVLPLSLGLVFAFMVVQMLNQSLADPKLAYLTPFAYYDLTNIISGGGYESSFLITEGILIVMFILLAYRIYNRKDLPSI